MDHGRVWAPGQKRVSGAMIWADQGTWCLDLGMFKGPSWAKIWADHSLAKRATLSF